MFSSGVFAANRPRPARGGRVPGAALAMRAKMAAASCNHDAPDGGSATRAGLAGFLINLQPLMKIPGPALDVNIISKSGSLKIDGALENFPDRLVKPARGGGSNALRLGKRMNAGFKQRLVRINISQA